MSNWKMKLFFSETTLSRKEVLQKTAACELLYDHFLFWLIRHQYNPNVQKNHLSSVCIYIYAEDNAMYSPGILLMSWLDE